MLVERTRDKIGGSSAAGTATKTLSCEATQTVVEDTIAFHYERERMAQFEAIELAEWPLFFAYELVTACCEARWEEPGLAAAAGGGEPGSDGACRSFPKLYLGCRRRRRGGNGSSPAARRGSPCQRSPALDPEPHLGWVDLLLNGLIKPETSDPLAVATRASRAPSRCLSPGTRQMPSIAAALWKRRACR